MLGDRFGDARTAEVAIEAEHAIARGHHDVQVVANQQHAAATRVSKPRNQGVKLGLASEIDAANGLVEHKQIWPLRSARARIHALQLATGNAGQLAT